MANLYDITCIDRDLPKEARKIADYLISSGLIPDMNIRNEHVRDVIQKRNEIQYHNTKLLLKKYRDIAWQLKYSPYEIAKELDWSCKDAEEVIKAISCECLRGNKALEYRIERLEQSVQMFQALNEALTILKSKPVNGEICYKILYQLYIQPDKIPVEQVILNIGIAKSSFYYLRDEAIETVSDRLWYSLPSRQIGMLVEAAKAYAE